ncbi:tyrosine phosphatase family domain-containing protein [Trichoderma ceciliae]
MAPPAPYICVPGVANFRDVGGYRIASQPGKEIRRNAVFRSARPSLILPRGVTKLKMLAITHAYDLRSRQELTSNGYDTLKMLWLGAERVSAPVFRPEEYSPDAVAAQFASYDTSCEGFVDAFSEILFSGSHVQNAARPFAQILEHLSSDSIPTPMLIHCHLGKDRAGVICALILSLCGVSDEVVAEEYHLTDVELASHHDELINKLMKNPAFKGTREDAKILVTSRKENMLCFLLKLRQRHGSIEQCILDYNLLQPDGIDRLKRNMIVDAAKNHSIVAPNTHNNVPNHKIIGTRQPDKSYSDRKSARVVALRPSGEVAIIHVKVGNYYKLPGGGIEADESHSDAALREVKEETGAVVALRDGCFATTEEFRFHLHQTSYCYLADVLDDTGKPCLTEEELADGFTHHWMTVSKALEVMSAVEPATEFGRYVKERDIYVLTKASGFINASCGITRVMPGLQKLALNIVLNGIIINATGLQAAMITKAKAMPSFSNTSP